MTNVIVAIDDIHPEQGWGVEGDVQVEYLQKLNEKHGVKFNLFVPSNYHGHFPITKDFVDFWTQYDWIELSNHGHYHACKTDGIGEMEFYELNFGDATQRIQDSLQLWKDSGYTPKGFRAPGWGVNQQSADAISNYFDWVAGHTDINKGINWGTHFFEGCDGINETEDISLYGNTFMFQSHINGTHNDNVWNEENFLHFDKIIEYLLSQYDLQFTTISEIK
jgi:peptidoglycan/xylan/chitin deacetylase (PgdA/CDA1 family)